MKRKGFTLIELLAVIVILAIIALIATPIILGIVKEAKAKTFRESLNNVFRAYEIYEVDNKLKDNQKLQKEVDISKLPINSNLKGTITRNENGELELKDVTDGIYCASGTKNDLNLIKGTCDDLYKNILAIKVNTNFNSRDVVITVDTLEGIPTGFSYKIIGPDNKMREKTTSSITYTFNKLKPETPYTIIVTATNKAGLKNEKIVTGETTLIDKIKLDLNLENEEDKDKEYIQSAKIKITYPNIEEGLNNEYKWCTQSEIESDECINKDFTPVTGNSIEVEARNGTLIAIVLDEEETVISNQITIENIDDVKPEVTLLTVQKTTKSITVPFSVTEEHIDKITCKYSDTIDTYTNNGTLGENACTLSEELKDNKTYYYQICVIDKAGNNTCKTGNTSTEEIANPGISITHTPSTASLSTTNGYSYKEVANITFTSTNITTPTYYIYSTASGVTNNNVIGVCTEENNLPKECTNVSTKNITSDTWYKVSGNINITYTTETETPITVYATTYDGKNYSGASTGTTIKIDRTTPDIEFETNGNNTASKLQSSVVNITENKSGINELKYKWSTSNEEDASNGTTFTSADTLTTPNNLNGTYYLCVYVSDLVGNESNTCSNAFKLDNTGPGITFGTNGNNTAARSQSSTITVTNDTYGASLDTSSYKYIFSTDNTEIPSTEFTSGTSYSQTSGTGDYYLIAKACDTLGNCTTATSNVFKLDNTGPSFTTSINGLKVTINNASDPSGLHATAYKCGSQDWQESNICTFTSEGTYEIKVRDALTNETPKKVEVVNVFTASMTIDIDCGMTIGLTLSPGSTQVKKVEIYHQVVDKNVNPVESDYELIRTGTDLRYPLGATWNGDNYFRAVIEDIYGNVAIVTEKIYFNGICFVAGTEVMLEKGFKNIEDIKVGDKVYSMQVRGQTINRGIKKVAKTYVRSTNETYILTIGNEELEVTGNHPIYVIGKGWTPAERIELNDKILTFDRNSSIVNSIEIKHYDEPIKVYNFEVQDYHSYLVTKRGLLVHNADYSCGPTW